MAKTFTRRGFLAMVASGAGAAAFLTADAKLLATLRAQVDAGWKAARPKPTSN